MVYRWLVVSLVWICEFIKLLVLGDWKPTCKQWISTAFQQDWCCWMTTWHLSWKLLDWFSCEIWAEGCSRVIMQLVTSGISIGYQFLWRQQYFFPPRSSCLSPPDYLLWAFYRSKFMRSSMDNCISTRQHHLTNQ